MPRKPPEPFNKLRTLADSSSSLDGSRLEEGPAEVRDAPPPPRCEVDIVEICRRWAEMAIVT